MFGSIYPGQMYPGGITSLVIIGDHVLIRLEDILFTKPFLDDIVLTGGVDAGSVIDSEFTGYMDTMTYNAPGVKPTTRRAPILSDPTLES